MPMTWSPDVTLVSVKEKFRNEMKCLKIPSKFVKSLTYGESISWAVPVFTWEQIYTRGSRLFVKMVVMSSLTVTCTSVYSDSEPWRFQWVSDDEPQSPGATPQLLKQAPLSPDYVPGLEYPPSPDIVPGPEYPEYVAPADEEIPIGISLYLLMLHLQTYHWAMLLTSIQRRIQRRNLRRILLIILLMDEMIMMMMMMMRRSPSSRMRMRKWSI
ncbi:hypothetical protein Tco_0039252 [Tanacetum coccineum]